ncbi:MAG: hypothetical protein LBR89_04940 [Holosporales bacterium]|nr:hypothetical protein [Holosporales bacterium]
MGRTSAILVSSMLVLVGGLFFASGYIMSRGLLHAQLPSFSKNAHAPSFDPEEQLATYELTDLSETPDDFAVRDLDSLAGLFSKKAVTRKPSPSVEQRKREPLIREVVPYTFPFRWQNH